MTLALSVVESDGHGAATGTLQYTAAILAVSLPVKSSNWQTSCFGKHRFCLLETAPLILRKSAALEYRHIGKT
jgi:hypothetical protein